MIEPAIFSLDGADWEFKGYLGEDWRQRQAFDPQSGDKRAWLPASVPGSVQNDLWQVGDIPDPYFERNSLLIEWVPQRTWVYRKKFFVPDSWQGQRIQLNFAGVDYAADFYLNGQLLGSHTGMYTPAVFDVAERIEYAAQNMLVVVIAPAPVEQPQVGRTSLVRTHKARMNYWWDHCPRMVHLGIWDHAYLKVNGKLRLEDVFVQPCLNEKHSQAKVDVSVDFSATEAQPGRLEIILTQEGEEVTRTDGYFAAVVGNNKLRTNLTVDHPQLWWPNGAGVQNLYQAEVRLYSGQAAEDTLVSDSLTTSFGIRRMEFIPNEGKSETARSYVMRVNGKRIYLQGWNWVPMDVLYGVERPEKLERLLQLAKHAGVNLLRVWGGGLIEKEEFYATCDRLGILVWQEFIQSSSGVDNRPAVDSEFTGMLMNEARQIIPKLRNHTSLAIWCGGNELMDDQHRPLDESHPVLSALHRVVRELDPERLWLPTSPSGPLFGFSAEHLEDNASNMHDVHGPWQHQGVDAHLDLYNQGVSLLHSEFGVEGITNRPALDAVIAPDHQSPVNLDNKYWMHLGAWWVREKTWQAIFNEKLSTVEQYFHATRFLQFDGLRYAVEAGRRRQYRNAGTIPWQFNEAYPMAANTSAVDYYARPKPAYYAVAGAYEPVHISARYEHQAWAEQREFTAQVWVSNDYHAVIKDAHLEARLLDSSGQSLQPYHLVIDVPSDGSHIVADLRWSLESLQSKVFFLDIQLTSAQGEHLSHNRYTFTRSDSLQPLLALQHTRLETALQVEGDCWALELTNHGRTVAFGAWVEDDRSVQASGYAWVEAPYFNLLPGEHHLVRVQWQDVPEGERCLALSGWNFEKFQVKQNGQTGLPQSYWTGDHLGETHPFFKIG